MFFTTKKEEGPEIVGKLSDPKAKKKKEIE